MGDVGDVGGVEGGVGGVEGGVGGVVGGVGGVEGGGGGGVVGLEFFAGLGFVSHASIITSQAESTRAFS